MRLSLSILTVVIVALFADGAQALAVSTVVDTDAQTVTLNFTDLPAYEQIRLENVTALSWLGCSVTTCPSSPSSDEFIVNGSNLEMNYDGGGDTPTNYITYHYLDGYIFTGFESVDWIVLTPLGGGDDVMVTGNRPLFVLVPEPSTALLCAFGLVAMSAQRRSARRAG
jgi:hypothetical protein